MYYVYIENIGFSLKNNILVIEFEQNTKKSCILPILEFCFDNKLEPESFKHFYVISGHSIWTMDGSATV